MKEAGRQAIAIPGDLRDEGFCTKLVGDAVLQLGGLDILVCNAARQQTRASILDISSEDFDATMKTNVYSPFWFFKAAVRTCLPGRSSLQPHRSRRRPITRDLRLCANKSCDDELCALTREATRAKRHSREWCGAGANLDALTGERRRDHGKIKTVRRQNTTGSPGATGRARIDLRPASRQRCQLCDRPGVRRSWRQRTTVSAGVHVANGPIHLFGRVSQSLNRSGRHSVIRPSPNPSTWRFFAYAAAFERCVYDQAIWLFVLSTRPPGAFVMLRAPAAASSCSNTS